MKTTYLTPLVAFQAFTAVMLFTAPALAAKAPLSNPDFTKGGVIPADAKHDWTLGATGARGWIFSEGFATSKARQIAITKVAKGSPADGIDDRLEIRTPARCNNSNTFHYSFLTREFTRITPFDGNQQAKGEPRSSP